MPTILSGIVVKIGYIFGFYLTKNHLDWWSWWRIGCHIIGNSFFFFRVLAFRVLGLRSLLSGHSYSVIDSDADDDCDNNDDDDRC